MTAPRIVPAGPHVRAIRGAFNQIFGRARSETQWRHIYMAAPLGAVGSVALDASDRILGYYGATLHRLRRDGCDAGLCALARDAFTRPEARLPGSRRRPLLASLFDAVRDEARRRGCLFIYGFSSERHFKLGSRLLDYQALDPGRHWRFDFAAMPTTPRPRMGKLEPVTAFDAGIQALAPPSPGFALDRDAAHLAWRYAPEQGGDYQRYLYRTLLADAPAGYAVIARRDGAAYLADAALPDDPNLLGDLWRQLATTLLEQGDPTLHAFCAGPTPLAAQFQMLNGISESGAPFGLPCFQWLDGRSEDAPAMILTPSDYDAL